MFRYVIVPHRGRFRVDQPARLGLEYDQPLLVLPARGEPPARPRLQSRSEACQAAADSARPSRSSVAYSSSLSWMSNAATFSSRCLTFEVPGIGSITGLRLSTQASEIWLGAAPCALAIRSRIESGLASSPAASGYHGMKPMP